jgi:NAD(P)-dependent dehydrogenase (short-subunit alcohol dehydrogenase family)
VPGDIADRKTAERAISEGVARFGRVDTLINNAGIFIAKPFTEYTEADYVVILGVNVAGFFHITQFAVAEMEKQGSGHVVQITTSLVDHAIAGVPSVLASLTKGGLAAATKSLAIEYARRGIRVNAVAPGIIKIADEPRRHVCATRCPAPRRPYGRNLRHRWRDPLPRVGTLRDWRNPSHRWGPERRSLNQIRRLGSHLFSSLILTNLRFLSPIAASANDAGISADGSPVRRAWACRPS